MVQTSIFDLRRFYQLDPENQQEVKDAIGVEYENTSSAPGLKHFVAQYFQLPKRTRDKINAVATKIFSENYRPLTYEEITTRTDYGVVQIIAIQEINNKHRQRKTNRCNRIAE